jgi:hypothetical protein
MRRLGSAMPMRKMTHGILVLNATISIDLTEWNSFLTSLGTNIKSTAPYLQTGANTFGFANVIRHFEDEQGPDSPWEPRTPGTQAMYAAIQNGTRQAPSGGRKGSYSPSNKLLQLTGRTKQSVLPGRGEIKRLNTHAVKLIAGTEYSGYINDGTNRMAARPFMWFDDRTVDMIGEYVLDSVMKKNP